MAVIPTQTDYELAQLKVRNNKIKVEVLNYNFQTVDLIEGNVIDGSVSIDATADIRRTCSVSIVPTKKYQIISEGGEFWLDKYIKIYEGIDNPRNNGETEWWNLGIFMINNPNRIYNATTNTITFEGLDLMAKLTGRRSGQLPAVTTIVPAGSKVADVVKRAITQLGGFKNYVIEDDSLWTEDNSISPNMQNDWRYVNQETFNIVYNSENQENNVTVSTQSGKWEQVFFAISVIPNIKYNFNFNVDVLKKYTPLSQYGYKGIRAQILSRAPENNSNSDKEIAYVDLSTEEGEKSYNIEFRPTTSQVYISFNFGMADDNQTVNVKINDMKLYYGKDIEVPIVPYDIKMDMGSTVYDLLATLRDLYSNWEMFFDTNGVFHWQKIPNGNDDAVVLDFDILTQPIIISDNLDVDFENVKNNIIVWGRLLDNGKQVTYTVSDMEPTSPFYIGKIGKINYIVDDERIYTDDLARQRAEYELFLHSRMNDAIILEIVPVYWLNDVDVKINYTNKKIGIEGEYLIKTLEIPLGIGGNMTINAIKVYPLLPQSTTVISEYPCTGQWNTSSQTQFPYLR